MGRVSRTSNSRFFSNFGFIHWIALALASSLLISGCQDKPPGFGVAGTQLRFQTVSFDDPEILAQVGSIQLTKSQILDKSVVLRDIEQQEQDVLIGLIYLHARSLSSDGGELEIFLSAPERGLDKILLRFNEPVDARYKVTYSEKRPPSILAKFGSQEIRREDLNLNHFVLQGLEQRKVEEIARQLGSQLARILANEEAKKQGLSLEQFITQATARKAGTDAEFQKSLEALALPQSEITTEIQARLRTAFNERKQTEALEEYVQTQILTEPVRVSFAPPKIQVRLDESFKALAGYERAPISVVAFSGSVCPDCQILVTSLAKILKKYDGFIRLNWVHTFEKGDGFSHLMATTSLCLEAQKQGQSLKFLQAFSGRGGQSDENEFYGWAEKEGLNSNDLRECVVQRQLEGLLDQHLEYTESIGVISRPTVWIEGQMIEGVGSFERLDQVLTRKIADGGYTQWTARIVRWRDWLDRVF